MEIKSGTRKIDQGREPETASPKAVPSRSTQGCLEGGRLREVRSTFILRCVEEEPQDDSLDAHRGHL